MKSPLKWLGGKSRLAGTVVRYMPPHLRYAEVFAGAGWVFFRKNPSRYESLNDINGDLVAFYRVLQHHLEEFCRQFKWLLSSREFFEDFKGQQVAGGLTDIQRAARFYYLQRHAFGGRVKSQSFGVSPDAPPPINLLRIEEELSAAHIRLMNVTVENLTWSDYIERYDGPDTLFYLDPPYHGCESDYGVGLFQRSDFSRMAEQLGMIEGKFLLSLNDNDDVRQVFAAYNIKEVETTYTVSKKAASQAREVLIANYDLESLRPSLMTMC